MYQLTTVLRIVRRQLGRNPIGELRRTQDERTRTKPEGLFLIRPGDIIGLDSMARALTWPATRRCDRYVWSRLGADTQLAIMTAARSGQLGYRLSELLARDLSEIILREGIVKYFAETECPLPRRLREAQGRRLSPNANALLNRLVLEAAYPAAFAVESAMPQGKREPSAERHGWNSASSLWY
jgi:hypothetical protein